jgi:hypothetical protein
MQAHEPAADCNLQPGIVPDDLGGRSGRPDKSLPANVADADTILSAVSFDEILSALGWDRLKQGRARCPVCNNDNKTALSVVESKGVYYCHRGGHGGDKADLVSRVNGSTRRAAIGWIAELAGLSYGMSREQWLKWKAQRDKEVQVFTWRGRLLECLSDLVEAFRTVEPIDEDRAIKAERSRQRVAALSGSEFIEWHDSRKLLPKVPCGDKWERLQKLRQSRVGKVKAEIEASRGEWLLMGACASPDEWKESLIEYSKRQADKGRDTRPTRSGRRDR